MIQDIKKNQEIIKKVQAETKPFSFPYEEMLQLKKINVELQAQSEAFQIKYNRDIEHLMEKLRKQNKTIQH